jgi:hypothetical protein
MTKLEAYQGEFNSIVRAFVFRALVSVYEWLGRRIDAMLFGMEV